MLEAMLDMYRRDHQLSDVAADRESRVQTVVNNVNNTRDTTRDTRRDMRDTSGGDSSNDDEGLSSYAIDEEETVDQFGNRMSMSRSRRPDDSDKMSRRAIANSNERRRMQSINAGFQQLKELVRPGDTEKLSKAAVLQHAVDFIVKLKYEKQRLAVDNDNLLRLLGVVPSSTSVTSPPCVADSAALRHQLPLYAITTSVATIKDHQDDHCPPFKRARLDDYSASSSSYSSSSFSSSSSVSSDEGVAEMSSGADRLTGSLTTMVQVESVTHPAVAVHCCVQADSRQKTSTSLVDRRRPRAERVDSLTECRPSPVGQQADDVDQLTSASGDAVWNCATKTASLDLEPSRCLVIKQEPVDFMRDVITDAPPSVYERLVATSGDAVVPVADDDSSKVKSDERSSRDLVVDCNWTTLNGENVVEHEELSVAMADCRSPSPCLMSSSMSQRNLETILKAIRYLEGDSSSIGHQPATATLAVDRAIKFDGCIVR